MKQSGAFDVIVVGAGHAGVEAAAAACRMGCRTALVTFDRRNVGALSCNPSIGGVGKGHLIREVDAFDGLGARAADAAAIHYRMLNRSKGRAVQGPRVQVDRAVFKRFVSDELEALTTLTIIEGNVVGLSLIGHRVAGIVLEDQSEIIGSTVVLATGTFLGARMFRGADETVGGRVGERAATALTFQLASVGHVTGRMKTGTPPRLDGRTIDWTRLSWQSSDHQLWTMSLLGTRQCPQIACAITHTNAVTHELVAENLSRSPLSTGSITGLGPRYCPSIEDKVSRFADRRSHQIFLEPEGLSDSTVYPNGVSTSLCTDTQQRLVNSIVGLERALITQWGYAVEYDFLDPRGLDHSLQSRAIEGLFCAGQINGTTGYEEASAQGLVAGCNAAALVLGKPALPVDRTNSYMGVLIDDLVLQGVTEPYRMLTARAEYRLSLRSDNADRRLTTIGIDHGCVGERRRQTLRRREAEVSKIERELAAQLTPAMVQSAGTNVAQDGVVRSAREWLRFADMTPAALGLDLSAFDSDIVATVVEDARYAPYLDRQALEIAALRGDESLIIPSTIDFSDVPGLSNEMISRLSAAQPPSLGAASRIRGVTPAALAAILLYVRRS